jgi:hypothetical protein
MADDHFANSAQPQQHTHIYRPIPRRNFSSNSYSQSEDSPSDWPQQPQPSSPPLPALSESYNRSSDFLTQLHARLLRTPNARNSSGNLYENGNATDGAPPMRNKSFHNLTSSTLFGIYDDVESSTAERSTAETPWGTGAETPARWSIDSGMGISGWENGMGSPDAGLTMKGLARKGTKDAQQQYRSPSRFRSASQPWGVRKYAMVTVKLSALFLFGVVYGVIVSHLHDTRELAAVRVGGIGRESWIYLASWGLAGTVLGSLLPYVDLVWDAQDEEGRGQESRPQTESERTLWEQWNEVVRSVGAFVGIAFAIVSAPPNSQQLDCANSFPAPPSLAIHPPAHPHPRPRQPSPLVHPRPQQTRSFRLPSGHLSLHIVHLPLEPRRPPVALATCGH